jgi:hypothetical protein
VVAGDNALATTAFSANERAAKTIE